MGLSGRKVKQRIGKDPRNLSWADDASRFGQSYLEKFGWDASKGLGASGEGRTNAVKMSQKLDMLGIGMQRHQNDPDGIAWRQNRDFENLLQRLNEGTEATGPFHEARGSSSSSSSTVEEVVAAEVDASHDADEAAVTDRAKIKKKQKKRKALQEEDEDEKAARDRGERKKRKKSKNDVPEDDASSLGAQAPAAPASESTPAPTAPIAGPAPIRALPRAHRARIIAAKRMAASNSTALAEILGISSSSTTVSPSPLTAATAATTPAPTPATSEDADPLQKLTTAAQSVGDYLRAKLGAKAGPRQNSFALVQDADMGGGDDDDDAPRAGLGAAARLVMTGPPDGSVRAASMLAALFARGQATAGAKEEADVACVDRADDDCGDAGDEEERRKSEGRHAKEERRKKKEDRRRRKEGKMRAIAEPDAEPPNGAQIVEPSMGEALPRRTERRKHRESDIPDDLLEHSSVSGDGRPVVVPKTKQKKRDKSRKTGRDANP